MSSSCGRPRSGSSRLQRPAVTVSTEAGSPGLYDSLQAGADQKEVQYSLLDAVKQSLLVTFSAHAAVSTFNSMYYYVLHCRELQQHLSGCVSVVRSLVTHMEALCGDYGELGRALSHFARFEESMAARQGQYTTAGSTAVQRGGDLQKLGYGALRQHSLSKQVTTPLTCQPCCSTVVQCCAARSTHHFCKVLSQAHAQACIAAPAVKCQSASNWRLFCCMFCVSCCQLVVSAGASLVFLPDYFALIPECIGTLQEREDALDAVNTLLQQQREQQEAADKMAASLGPAADADKRMVAVKSSIHALQVTPLYAGHAAEQQPTWQRSATCFGGHPRYPHSMGMDGWPPWPTQTRAALPCEESCG